jgi:hypothetical protein
MLRSITATLLFVLCPFASAQDAQPARLVSLNAPGAMETIKATRPAHYDAIQGIAAGLARNPHSTDARWIQTSFHAKDVSYGMALLTSYPPKKDIAFTLDETRYQGRVTLGSGRVYFIPTR